MYATGIGNIFSDDITIPSLTGKTLVLVKPDVFVSTREAYSMIVPAKPENPLSQCINQPIGTWKDTICNDFEASVFPKHPLIRQVKETLYELGAIYASMSGSGSSVFGIFDKPVELDDKFPGMFVMQNTF